MFTRAGFSRRYHVRWWSKVSMIGSHGWVGGFLVHWPAAGEFAWGSSTRIVWPHQVRIGSLIRHDWGSGTYPSSKLPQ